MLNKLLKIAAALAAFWLLVFTNQSAAAQTNLVKNGDFYDTYSIPYFTRVAATDWPLPYAATPPTGATLDYCTSTNWFCSSTTPYAVSIFSTTGKDYVYPEGSASPPVISQLINGLQIGHNYAVNFSSWGDSLLMGPTGNPPNLSSQDFCYGG